MKTISSSMTTILLLSFLAFFLFSIIQTGSAVIEAQNYQNQVIEELEDSHFNGEVIKRCKESASQKGYILMIEEDGVYENRISYRISLTYELQIALLKYKKTNEVSAYA